MSYDFFYNDDITHERSQPHASVFHVPDIPKSLPDSLFSLNGGLEIIPSSSALHDSNMCIEIPSTLPPSFNLTEGDKNQATASITSSSDSHPVYYHNPSRISKNNRPKHHKPFNCFGRNHLPSSLLSVQISERLLAYTEEYRDAAEINTITDIVYKKLDNEENIETLDHHPSYCDTYHLNVTMPFISSTDVVTSKIPSSPLINFSKLFNHHGILRTQAHLEFLYQWDKYITPEMSQCLSLAMTGFDLLISTPLNLAMYMCMVLLSAEITLRMKLNKTSGPYCLLLASSKAFYIQILELFNTLNIEDLNVLDCSATEHQIRLQLKKSQPDIIIGCLHKILRLADPKPIIADDRYLEVLNVSCLIVEDTHFSLHPKDITMLENLSFSLKKPHQTLIFSQQHVQEVQDILKNLFRKNMFITIERNNNSDISPEIVHEIVEVKDEMTKTAAVIELLGSHYDFGNPIIFCSNLLRAEQLCRRLKAEKFNDIEVIKNEKLFLKMNELLQSEHNNNNNDTISISIATDFVIQEFINPGTLIINYDIPNFVYANCYNHRLALCGIKNKNTFTPRGRAVTLILPHEKIPFKKYLTQVLIDGDLQDKLPSALNDD